MKYNILLLFLLSVITINNAQETPTQFTLNEAISYALTHNRTAINAEKDIEAAKKRKWETTATGLPQINAGVDYQNFLKQPVSLIPAEIFGGPPGTFEEVVFGTKQNVNATATLSQLIFDGSYLVGLQSAKVFLEISKNAKEKTDLEVKKAVINAYGNVLLAEESIKILEKNQKNLEKTLFETQKIYENGLGDEESVEQLQITLLSVENNLNNTKRLKTVAYKMLNITLGIDMNTSITLTDTLDDLTLKNIVTDTDDETFSIENNIDYKIAENNKRAQELLVKLEKSKALPRLNGFINGSYQGFSDEFTFLESDQRWFGTSLIGVSLNVPIFSSLGRTARTQRAKIELDKANNDLTESQQRINLQLETAKSNYQFAIENYNTTKKNLDLAARIEKKNQIKYSEGVASSFELRQAQTQLYNTQQEYLQAMLNIITQKTELETILNSKP